jgi:hypothetical protein
VNPYIRAAMRYFCLIGLFVFIAQESWAFAVSDTLIIDGEVIYIEEQNSPITDSLNQARKNDFKEKRKAPVWGFDGGFGFQMTDFSISNQVYQQLVGVNEFLGISNNTVYHSNLALGAYFRAHKNIEIGGSVLRSNGTTNESNALAYNTSNTVSFFTGENQIQQVFQTEVQPGVFELDTVSLSTFSQTFSLSSLQVALKFRFYVNDFAVKSKWRAFGEISPIYRSFKLKNMDDIAGQMLFLNSTGSFVNSNLSNQNWNQFGVLVGVGSEFHLTKNLNAFVQANWSFPPVSKVGESGVNYHMQYSNLFLGLRILMNDGK